jgi:hypothetical protein
VDFRTLPKNVLPTLRKYNIVSKPAKPARARENWTQTAVTSEGLGTGPLLDPEVVDRFLQADITPDKQWLDWMLFQAGGGRPAKARSKEFLQHIKEDWFSKHTKGYTNKRTGVKYPPVSMEEAQRAWTEAEPRFIKLSDIGDQDLVTERNVFGYFRHWPGQARIYEQIALAVNKFLKLRRKVVAANKHGVEVSMEPSAYSDVRDLQAAIQKVEAFFNTRAARMDYRIDNDKKIYDDPVIEVIAPLTYAAAVRYGWDEWEFSNPEKFTDQLTRGDSGSTWNTTSPWAKFMRDGNAFVFIHFKHPVPGWVSFENEQFRYYSLTNLAMVLPEKSLRHFNTQTTPVYDEENRHVMTLQDVKQMILNEPKRDYDADKDEYPYKNPRVYSEQSEAEEIVRHFEAALQAIKQWGRTFDYSRIVKDPMQAGERPSRPDAVVDNLLDIACKPTDRLSEVLEAAC